MALVCANCGGTFPRLGQVPILLADARSRLTTLAAALGARRGSLNAERETLAQSALDPRLRFRAAALEQRRQGLLRNRALLEDELGDLLESVMRSGGPSPAGEAPAIGESFGEGDTSALFTDWSLSPEAEREIETVCALAREMAGPPPASLDGRALFLGAGVGRHAVELGRAFRSALAIDLSVDRMWLFNQVLHRPLEFAAFEDGAPLIRDGLTRLVRTEPPPAVAGLRLAVADARRLPVSDASVSHVFSIYFTDMIPLAELLPEVARVLAPDGTFVHVGPLHYAFRDAAWRLAPDELPEAFRQFGFEIQGQREQSLELGHSSASGLELHYRALVFRARRIP